MSESIGQSPSLRQAFLVWGLATIYFTSCVLAGVSFGLFAGQVQKALAVSANVIGMLSAVYLLAYAVTQFFAGILMDRVSPRWILGLSALVAALGCGLFAHATNLEQALAGQALLGSGLSTSLLGAIFLASVWFPPERFALVSGATQVTSTLVVAAAVIGMSMSGAIPAYRKVMSALAVVYLLLGVLMLLFVRRPPKAELPASKSAAPAVIAQLLTVVTTPQFWWGSMFFGCSFGVWLAWNNLWDIQNQRAYGRSLELAGSMNAMMPLGGGLGGLVLGWLSDRLGRRPRIAQLTIGSMTAVLTLLLFLPRLPTPVVFGLLFVFGFVLGGNVLGFAQVGQHVPQQVRATAFGLMTSVGFSAAGGLNYLIGNLVGQAPPGGTDLAIKHYQVALMPLLVVLIVGSLCSMALKDPAPSLELTKT
jgi:nitrate/nitrite transporter NarK